MEFTFICPACFQEINTDSSTSGTEAVCPTCETALKVPSPDDAPQALLGGYALEKCLGEGRTGIVYLANQVTMNRRVALKILNPELTDDVAYVTRFVDETRVNAQIEHPNVVKVFDVGVDEASGHVYSAMSLIEGETVAERIASKGAYGEKEALGIALAIAKTLDFVQERHGLRHQNLTPSRVYIDRHNKVKLSNLGITRHKGDQLDPNATGSATAMLYMSPEQALGKDADARADMYSLGVTLYEMLTGKQPDAGAEMDVAQVKAARGDLSDGTQRLVAAMLQQEAGHRHETWKELISDIERCEGGKLPLRQVGGALLSEDEVAALAAPAAAAAPAAEPEGDGEAGKGLRLRKDAAEDKAKAEAEAEAADDEYEDTPTIMEERGPIPLAPEEEAAEAKKSSPGKKVLKAVAVVLILALAFQYGFGPVISAVRQQSTGVTTESMVYVVNGTETDYKLTLGWRRLKREVRAGMVTNVKLFVGMSEKQGLKVVSADGSEKFKVKVPLKPGCVVLVNLKQAKTYYIYDPDVVKDAKLSNVTQLAGQIQAKRDPEASVKVAEQAITIANRAVKGSVTDEVIDLLAYQSQMTMVGSGTSDREKDPTLPILSDQTVVMPINGGARISYAAGKKDHVNLTVPMGIDGRVNLGGGIPAITLPKTLSVTIDQKGETISTSVRTGNVDWKKKVLYKAPWIYSATRQGDKPWTWYWSYSATANPNTSLQHRLVARVPKSGKPEVKETEVKR